MFKRGICIFFSIKYNGPEPHLVNWLHFAKKWTQDHKFTDDPPKNHGDVNEFDDQEEALENEEDEDNEEEFYKKTILY